MSSMIAGSMLFVMFVLACSQVATKLENLPTITVFARYSELHHALFVSKTKP